LKYNFLKTSAAVAFSRDFDFFDDKFWDNVCCNYGTLAWFAKQTGMRGLLIDIEDYTKSAIWRYRASCGHSYAEAWDIARTRGRQFMMAMAKEYPDIHIFTFFWFDLAMGYADGSPDTYKRIATSSNGLLVAFANGMYDVMPPKAKIIDGFESYSYRSTGYNSLNEIRGLRTTRFKRFIAPENQRKFREQTSLAIATYIAQYIGRSTKFKEEMRKNNMNRLEFFRRNTALAADYSDEYIWLYNETRTWYPCTYPHFWMRKALKHFPGVPGPLVGMAIPGIEEALDYIRNPYIYAKTALKNGNISKNLIKNPDFENETKGDIPRAPDCHIPENISPWSTWQNKHSKGIFSLAKTEGINGSKALKITSVLGGCAIQSVKIKPYGVYIVRACVKSTANATASLCVRWQKPDGSWNNNLLGNGASFTEDIGNGWKRATVLIRFIPENCNYLVVLLCADTTGKKTDIILFDDVEVFELFSQTAQVAPHLKNAMKKWESERTLNSAAEAVEKNAKKSKVKDGNLITKGSFNYKSRPVKYDSINNNSILFEIGPGKWRKKETTKIYRIIAKGIGFTDDSAAIIRDGDGCITFPVYKIREGEKYTVKAKCKNFGKGTPSLSVYWSTRGLKGPFNYAKGTPKFFFTKPATDGWLSAEGTITVPQGVDYFTVLASASRQGNSDELRFDDIEAYKIKTKQD
jgi:hypothetical protein